MINNANKENSDALWFTYDFPYYALHNEKYPLQSGWVSGMAQGIALATFSQLADLTNNIFWQQAADKTLLSLLYTNKNPDKNGKWCTRIVDGALWFEEYPFTDAPTQVINGHLFTVQGLQYVWIRTHSRQIETLISQATTAVVNNFNNFRQIGKPSFYCAAKVCQETKINPENYHRIVISQLTGLSNTTADPHIKDLVDTLSADSPTNK